MLKNVLAAARRMGGRKARANAGRLTGPLPKTNEQLWGTVVETEKSEEL